ncbi:MAG: dTDP-4-dehydrorhamnose 3,5-epimerase [Bacteroidota bacterium]
MKITQTDFSDLLVIEPKQFTDERGIFFESYVQKKYSNQVSPEIFVQDNCSVSKKNVLRGMHFQAPPFAQAKLVYVLNGSALDIVVDLRKSSPTYGKNFSIELSDKNKKQLFIPRGFAHGFCALEPNTIFSYKCDNYYHQESERTLLWNDNDLNLPWPEKEWLISDKDHEGISFSNFVSPF